ncbi:MAG: nitrilase family protein [Muribaculaceae bacterium]|nr:nitrilase family protein [Muribaculaceae bacterium]
MKICVIPFDIKYASPEENLIAAAHALNEVEKDTDVVVLPELFTTAFVPDTKGVSALAEGNDGQTVEALKRWAAFFGFAIAGSFLAKGDDGKFYNRAFFIEPMGDATFYDKRHLFPLSTEDKVYSPGHELAPIVRFRGWDFKIIICFDLRFPVWCRNVKDHLYDVLLVPANWPSSREKPFKILMQARAVENQVYTVGANRSGEDNYGEYHRSSSAIYDNWGDPIHETRRNGYLYALLERKDIEIGREKFPAYKAMDRWEIDL